jgi:hypothetical protein
MNETINCPACQRKLAVPENLLGQEVQCPSCSARFNASPDRTGPAPPPLPSSPPPAPEWREAEREPDLRRSRRYQDDDDEDGYARPPRRRRQHYVPHRGPTILVLGILSLFVAQIILGPIAWVMANHDLREMREGRMDPEGEDNTNTGRICAMIATIIAGSVLALVGVLFLVCMLGVLVNVK